MNTCNVLNRTIFCRDNLEILRGINSECIDLIYLDPPFNKKKVFTAPIGTSAEGASFKDIFTQEDIKDEWVQTIKEDRYAIYELLHAVRNIEGHTSYNFCYLAYMAIRIIECHRILKETGSIYVHCDHTMSHYLKLLLDCIFGEKNFRNEITWNYYGPGSPDMRQFNRKHDTIFWYVNGEKWIFNKNDVRLPYKDPNQQPRKAFDTGKSFEAENIKAMQERGKVPEDWWVIRIAARSKDEYTGYPTQKPLALLERIIKASSNTGGIVLDPFCGCATTCVAAEKLDRQWIGIDISVKAYELVKARIMKEAVRPDALFDVDKEVHYTTATPIRTDDNADAKDQKYVYVISHKRFPGEYKVGIARNVRSRLNSYQTGDPNRAYKLEHALLTGHYRALERHIHATFDSRHEWVRGDLAEIIAEIGRYTPLLNTK